MTKLACSKSKKEEIPNRRTTRTLRLAATRVHWLLRLSNTSFKLDDQLLNAGAMEGEALKPTNMKQPWCVLRRRLGWSQQASFGELKKLSHSQILEAPVLKI